MLYVLTGIYWASISAARAPKGRFCPDFLSFVVQFWAKIVFSPNIGVWGVQIIATERPAHTSLLQPIWNHPAQGNGQKQAKKGSFGPKVPLLVALEVLGGRRGPYLVTTVTGHTVPDEKLNTSKKMTRKGGSRKNYNSRQVRWMGRNHYADI